MVIPIVITIIIPPYNLFDFRLGHVSSFVDVRVSLISSLQFRLSAFDVQFSRFRISDVRLSDCDCQFSIVDARVSIFEESFKKPEHEPTTGRGGVAHFTPACFAASANMVTGSPRASQ